MILTVMMIVQPLGAFAQSVPEKYDYPDDTEDGWYLTDGSSDNDLNAGDVIGLKFGIHDVDGFSTFRGTFYYDSELAHLSSAFGLDDGADVLFSEENPGEVKVAALITDSKYEDYFAGDGNILFTMNLYVTQNCDFSDIGLSYSVQELYCTKNNEVVGLMTPDSNMEDDVWTYISFDIQRNEMIVEPEYYEEGTIIEAQYKIRNVEALGSVMAYIDYNSDSLEYIEAKVYDGNGASVFVNKTQDGHLMLSGSFDSNGNEHSFASDEGETVATLSFKVTHGTVTTGITRSTTLLYGIENDSMVMLLGLSSSEEDDIWTFITESPKRENNDDSDSDPDDDYLYHEGDTIAVSYYVSAVDNIGAVTANVYYDPDCLTYEKAETGDFKDSRILIYAKQEGLVNIGAYFDPYGSEHSFSSFIGSSVATLFFRVTQDTNDLGIDRKTFDLSRIDGDSVVYLIKSENDEDAWTYLTVDKYTDTDTDSNDDSETDSLTDEDSETDTSSEDDSETDTDGEHKYRYHKGDRVAVKYTIRNFDNIGSFTAQMNYSPSELEFDHSIKSDKFEDSQIIINKIYDGAVKLGGYFEPHGNEHAFASSEGDTAATVVFTVLKDTDSLDVDIHTFDLSRIVNGSVDHVITPDGDESDSWSYFYIEPYGDDDTDTADSDSESDSEPDSEIDSDSESDTPDETDSQGEGYIYHKGDLVAVDYIIKNVDNIGAFTAKISYDTSELKYDHSIVPTQYEQSEIFVNLISEGTVKLGGYFEPHGNEHAFASSEGAVAGTAVLMVLKDTNSLDITIKTIDLSRIENGKVENLITPDGNETDEWSEIVVKPYNEEDSDTDTESDTDSESDSESETDSESDSDTDTASDSDSETDTDSTSDTETDTSDDGYRYHKGDRIAVKYIIKNVDNLGAFTAQLMYDTSILEYTSAIIPDKFENSKIFVNLISAGTVRLGGIFDPDGREHSFASSDGDTAATVILTVTQDTNSIPVDIHTIDLSRIVNGVVEHIVTPDSEDDGSFSEIEVEPYEDPEPVDPIDDPNVIRSGYCGDNARWILYNDGTLRIYGEGTMYDYDNENTFAPWYMDRAMITKLIVEKGITSIGSSAFRNCQNLADVDVADSVKRIGRDAFTGTKWFNDYEGDFVVIVGILIAYRGNEADVSIPLNVRRIEEGVFDGNTTVVQIEIFQNVESIADGVFVNCPSLTDIYYDGYEEDWQKIDLGEYNPQLEFVTIHFRERPSDIMLGDVDGDGEITANDAILVLRASIGTEEFDDTTFIAGDVDGDGEITANDAIMILRQSIGYEEF